VREPVTAGRDPEAALELPREMTLVGEPSEGGDRREPFLRAHEPLGRPLESEATALLADALSVVGTKGASEMGGVKTDLAGDL